MEPSLYQLPQDLTPDPADVVILGHVSRAASYLTQVALHCHLFSFPTEGEKLVMSPTGTVRAAAGQFLLLPTGHCLMSEKRAGPTGAYRSTMLFFSGSSLREFFAKYPALAAGPAEAPAVVPVFEVDAFLEHFVASLNLLLAEGAPVPASLGRLKLEELLLYLCRQPASRAALCALAAMTAEHLEIRQVVEAHAHSPVSVEDLAFLCHTSVSTFKRRFARLYGTSPNKWLVQRRLALAAELLAQGELKASDVYYRVGYQNMSSFIQAFKQVYGLTPKKFQGQQLSV